MDGCDFCGSAGLAGPLAARAPRGFGCWAGGGLGGFPEALPECSFNLLLTGPQAVLGTKGNCEEGLLGEREEGPLGAKGPLPSPPQHLAAGAKDGHLPVHWEVWGVRPQPSPRNQPSILRNSQEDVARECESSPASDTKPPPPLLHAIGQERCPSTRPRLRLLAVHTRAGDKGQRSPKGRAHETRTGDQVEMDTSLCWRLRE